MDFVHLENARTEEQKDVMRKIQKDNVCPFCTENLTKYHKKDIFNEGKYWILTENQWPYEDTKKHLLAISKKHAEQLSDLEPEAGAELIELFQKVIKDFEVEGGTLAMRFGNTTKYASSVRHLHVHLIEPDVENPNHKGVKFPVSKPSTQQK